MALLAGMALGTLIVVRFGAPPDELAAVLYLASAAFAAAALRELLVARQLRSYGASHDVVTGLPNVSWLVERIEAALRSRRRSAAVLVVGLGELRSVREDFGHEAGDALLAQVGPRLRRHVRETDAVARIGADEVAMLIGAADIERATAVGRRVLEAMTKPFQVNGEAIGIGVSVGIAVGPEHATSANLLLAQAETAMERARGSVEPLGIHVPSAATAGQARLALLAELRSAIEGRALILHYQPLVSAASGRVSSVEALVRWRHLRRGLVPPGEFLPLAEKTELIKPLTRLVLDEALRQIRKWDAQGWKMPVAVNLSTRSLLDPELLQTVRDALSLAQVPPTMLRLEITESVLLADPEASLRTLASLRQMGIQLSLDDFGTGFSSLSYLHRMPLDVLKVDRSFVAGLSAPRSTEPIVRATIELGHRFGYQVVAEGVEDRATYEKLVVLGCDAIQGFYLTKPLPADEVVSFFPRRASITAS